MGNLFLTLGVFEWIGDKISSGFTFIMLLIDNVVYWFASQCYQLFIKLSMTRLFEDAFFSDFANRIYAILGVFMLFYLAYALLNALVDPDKLAKGDKSVSKLAMNFVVSLVILGFLPSIFNYAYRLQNFILSENVIGTLVFGDQSVSSNGDNMIKYGDALSFTILNTFINPDNYNVELSTNYNWWNLKQDILENSDYSHLPSLNKAIVYGANEITDEGVSSTTVYPEYKVILSTIVGIYLCYIMVSFVLDLGVRVVKLAFCQLIAPIPVLMRAMPSKKSSFDKWLKLTLSIYFEVFVRVGFIYLSVYFINAIMENNRLADIFFSGGIQGMLALVVVILGILTFAKQAPKMISDILGIDTGNMKLGISDKIKGSLDGLNSFGFAGKATYFLGKNTIGKGFGMVTGALGGLSTGILDGNINTWAAMKQGASAGFKKGGNQFGTQRSKTFESYYGYGVEQGLFGPSFGQRFADAHKDDVGNKRKEDFMNTINKYENDMKFTNTFQIDLDSGDKYETILRNMFANVNLKKVFDDAEAAALNYAIQNNINTSDPRYAEKKNEYLENFIKYSTDENLKRAVSTAREAENRAEIWRTFEHTVIAGVRETTLFKKSDSAIDSMTGLTPDEKEKIKNDKKIWESGNYQFASDLASGNKTRNEDGTKDKIYNSEYAKALVGLGKDPRKESDTDILRKLLGKK